MGVVVLRRCLSLIFACVMLAAPAQARPAVDAIHGRPPPILHDKVRCTDDGRDCIRLEHYVLDVCTMIERNAADHQLDPNFLARLLWKESRFEPSAVSPAGAQGIAQFMPGTARLYRLDDPFNPAQAIAKSAWYLRYLTDMFGNVGLAAVAYNGGENRAQRFINEMTVLPYETQDYVQSITGHNAWAWRDNPPGGDALKLALDDALPFHDACVKLAGNRSLREFTVPQRVFPWGVLVASHPTQSGAQQQVQRLNRTLRPILGGQQVGFVRRPLRNGTRPVFTAQVGFQSRGEAGAFCNRLRAAGGTCIVLRN
ncbi:MAG: lytic transglycosylase domain-containing protein [Paracoccus sp. (in: a-proteobacteria)]|uniref:lytic transglycosylase domain-containing protein n=1 Tax=Paracoccus sp. TaxID=267 RepID=UPI0026E0C553|nr:lytic transglycosylase domain-containing protein [Paracoccus sp. (in: a-proteobacteria)]MDO5612809.1 lytic transglycosylase domain-containing protein [Paracoccus sp. (in: a-proteobacteria)]